MGSAHHGVSRKAIVYVTKQAQMQDDSIGSNGLEIEVTAAMLEAGMHELFERNFREGWPYVLECVFRAMAYKSPQLRPQDR